MKGRVKWFSSQKGYGFITPTDGGKDVFCHFSALINQKERWRTLNEGDEVEFEVINGERGMQAADVRLIKASTPSQQKEIDQHDNTPADVQPDDNGARQNVELPRRGFKRTQRRGEQAREGQYGE
jgi:CspA family cold shock protein